MSENREVANWHEKHPALLRSVVTFGVRRG
jgi:hypothetical protein